MQSFKGGLLSGFSTIATNSHTKPKNIENIKNKCEIYAKPYIISCKAVILIRDPHSLYPKLDDSFPLFKTHLPRRKKYLNELKVKYLPDARKHLVPHRRA